MGCTTVMGNDKSGGKLETVSTTAFDKGLKNGDVQILDVRTPEEYAEGHIKGAVNIDVYESDFQAAASDSLSVEKPVYVYCRSGRRSLMAGEMLAKEGYNVVDLDGGIIAWEKAGLPVVKD